MSNLPHPNPSFAFGVPLRSSVFPAVYMCTRCSGGFGGRQRSNYMIEFLCPTPYPSASSSPRTVFNLLLYCRLHKGVQDPVSFTVTTGLLGRLGLGLRVRVSIRIIFTFFSEFIINLFPYCNKSRYERHLSNVSVNDQSKFSRKIVSCCCRLP